MRYIRQITLAEVGERGQKKISASKVLVVGAGGLGSPALLYLAGAGVGTIGVVDDDLVSVENLHRQIIHKSGAVGFSKARSARENINGLNPDINIIAHETRVTEENAVSIIKNYDFVVDATDNFLSRYVLNKACVGLKAPLVHGAVLKYQGQASVFAPHLGTACYNCVYPEPPPERLAPSGRTAGIMGMIPGIIGTLQALEVIKLIVGLGDPLLGKLLIFDGLKSRMKILSLNKDPKCGVCS